MSKKICDCGQSFEDHKNNKCSVIYSHVDKFFNTQGILSLSINEHMVVRVGDIYIKIKKDDGKNRYKLFISAPKDKKIERFQDVKKS